MKTRTCLIATLLMLCTSAALADKIYIHGDGKSKSGKVTEMSPQEVGLSGKPPYAANTVRYIRFDGEPKDLSLARSRALSGNYTTALKYLKRVDAGSISNPMIRADMAFFKAYGYAHLGLTSTKKRDTHLNNAVKLLTSYINGAGKNHYRFYEAQELLGDVSLALGKSKKDAALLANANKQYDAASTSAPWPDVKLRLSMKKAKALQAEGKASEALTLYRTISESSLEGPEVESYKGQARLGMAEALTADNKAGEAIALINGVINATNPEDLDTMGQAYLAMARCAKAGDKPKEERMAYLHIDLLYFQNPEAHEEALGRLAELWEAENQPEKASDAMIKLRRKFPNSQYLKR